MIRPHFFTKMAPPFSPQHRGALHGQSLIFLNDLKQEKVDLEKLKKLREVGSLEEVLSFLDQISVSKTAGSLTFQEKLPLECLRANRVKPFLGALMLENPLLSSLKENKAYSISTYLFSS